MDSEVVVVTASSWLLESSSGGGVIVGKGADPRRCSKQVAVVAVVEHPHCSKQVAVVRGADLPRCSKRVAVVVVVSAELPRCSKVRTTSKKTDTKSGRNAWQRRATPPPAVDEGRGG